MLTILEGVNKHLHLHYNIAWITSN